MGIFDNFAKDVISVSRTPTQAFSPRAETLKKIGAGFGRQIEQVAGPIRQAGVYDIATNQYGITPFRRKLAASDPTFKEANTKFETSLTALKTAQEALEEGKIVQSGTKEGQRLLKKVGVKDPEPAAEVDIANLKLELKMATDNMKIARKEYNKNIPKLDDLKALASARSKVSPGGEIPGELNDADERLKRLTANDAVSNFEKSLVQNYAGKKIHTDKFEAIKGRQNEIGNALTNLTDSVEVIKKSFTAEGQKITGIKYGQGLAKEFVTATNNMFDKSAKAIPVGINSHGKKTSDDYVEKIDIIKTAYKNRKADPNKAIRVLKRKFPERYSGLSDKEIITDMKSIFINYSKKYQELQSGTMVSEKVFSDILATSQAFKQFRNTYRIAVRNGMSKENQQKASDAINKLKTIFSDLIVQDVNRAQSDGSLKVYQDNIKSKAYRGFSKIFKRIPIPGLSDVGIFLFMANKVNKSLPLGINDDQFTQMEKEFRDVTGEGLGIKPTKPVQAGVSG